MNSDKVSAYIEKLRVNTCKLGDQMYDIYIYIFECIILPTSILKLVFAVTSHELCTMGSYQTELSNSSLHFKDMFYQMCP